MFGVTHHILTDTAVNTLDIRKLAGFVAFGVKGLFFGFELSAPGHVIARSAAVARRSRSKPATILLLSYFANNYIEIPRFARNRLRNLAVSSWILRASPSG